jgi:urease accessory protein
VLEEMLRGLGGKVTAIEAPFDPQATLPHAHSHGHHPHHGHHHDHD